MDEQKVLKALKKVRRTAVFVGMLWLGFEIIDVATGGEKSIALLSGVTICMLTWLFVDDFIRGYESKD